MSELFEKIKEFFSSLVAKIKAIFTKEDDTDTDDTDIVRPIRDDDDIVCYYGCPNSNKVKKLQLEKKLYK